MNCTEILAYLAAHPTEAYVVTQRLRVAGPWVRRGGYWVRPNPTSDHGGAFGHVSYPATVALLERADAKLRAEGYLLAGGTPSESPGVVPECGEVHEMTQGRPRLPRPTDPRQTLACQYPRGHVGACGALAPTQWVKGDEETGGEVWWTASNAMTRGAK